jgi:GEVED domain/Secretion system C-terminal sorting domain/Fibronectin type III domain
LCSPTFVSGCSSWKTLSIVAGTINWTAPSSCTTSNFTTTSTTVASGGTLPMTVVNGDWCGCSVWADFNNNFLMDANENLYSSYASVASATYNFSITIPGSVPNGTYTMRVLSTWGADGTSPGANGSGGCGAYQYGNFQDFSLIVGTPTPCNAPTGLTVTGITATNASISWAASPGAQSYEYAINTSTTPPTGSGTFIGTTTYNASGLTASTPYYAHVRSYCGAGNYSPWTTVPFTTALPPCLAPSVTGSNLGSNSATLSWGAVATAVNYEYVLDNIATPPTGAGTSISATTYNATSLSPLTSYYFHVRTNCGAGGFSPWTNYAFATQAITCLAPTGLASSNITSIGATFNWTPGTSALSAEYIVNNSGGIPTGSGTNITATTYVANGLTPNTLYYYHIRSNCGAGIFSNWFSMAFTTAAAPCVTPTNLLINGISQNTATLNWTASAGAVNYEYEVNTTNITPAGNGLVANGGTSQLLNSLLPGTNYYAFVRSHCGNNNFSPWTAAVSFATVPESIKDVQYATFAILANPNPVKSELTVNILNQKTPITLQLTDIFGKVYFSKNSVTASSIFDCSTLAKGMYFLNATDGVFHRSFKIIKE